MLMYPMSEIGIKVDIFSQNVSLKIQYLEQFISNEISSGYFSIGEQENVPSIASYVERSAISPVQIIYMDFPQIRNNNRVTSRIDIKILQVSIFPWTGTNPGNSVQIFPIGIENQQSLASVLYIIKPSFFDDLFNLLDETFFRGFQWDNLHIGCNLGHQDFAFPYRFTLHYQIVPFVRRLLTSPKES